VNYPFKGIVHPQIIFVITYSPSCCSKPVWVSYRFYSAEHKIGILKNVGNKTADSSHW